MHTLLEEHQVLCLLEMRGSAPAIRVWLGGISRTHEVFISSSGGGEATAGIVILLHKEFARLQHVTSTFSSFIIVAVHPRYSLPLLAVLPPAFSPYTHTALLR